jgi:hypothetical protein
LLCEALALLVVQLGGGAFEGHCDLVELAIAKGFISIDDILSK